MSTHTKTANTANIADSVCINTLTLSELNTVHSAISHNIIDNCRTMRHSTLTCAEHNAISAHVTTLQRISGKIGAVIEASNAARNSSAERTNDGRTNWYPLRDSTSACEGEN